MPLARLHAPFDHADWIFEAKLDGFRAMAYIRNCIARLVSRRKTSINQLRDAILDPKFISAVKRFTGHTHYFTAYRTVNENGVLRVDGPTGPYIP